LLLAGYLGLTSGCVTNYVVEWKAKPHVEFDKIQQQDIQVAGQPAYYVLLPISIPVDIVSSPIQLCVLLAWPAAKAPNVNTSLSPPYRHSTTNTTTGNN
jgi:hypothetical protein